MNRSCFILFILLTFTNISQGQNSIEKDFIANCIIPLKKYNIEYVEKRKESIRDSFLLIFIKCQIEKFKYGKIKPETVSNLKKTSINTPFKEALYNLTMGDYLLKGNPAKAINLYEQVYDISKSIENAPLICEALKRLCSYFSNTQKREHTIILKKILKRYKNYRYDDYENFIYNHFYLIYKMQLAYNNSTSIKKSHFFNLIKLAKKTENKILIGDAYKLTGAYHIIFSKNSDSASNYYLLAKKKFYVQSNAEFYKTKYDGISLNMVKNSLNNSNLDSLKLDLNNISPSYDFRLRLSKSQFLKELYLKMGDYKNAYIQQSNEKKLNDSLNHIQVTDIQTKYEVKRKEQENITLKKDKQNLLIGSLFLILFGGITAFLIQKNTRKKQKLAEQEKALETQKLATVLKEQELTAIDAMIEGQEKERQRIANDLHDDLGGLMATVKLHFNELNNEKKAGKLFEKTNDLLDEAYNKIRSIAHAKNSGVIAKQGLLIAVQNMADKISVSNKINIEVIDHGLENRLENSLELTIFRIIQELVTNIIKHAEATEANIHLTNHDNTINIMIEDNGKGFNPNQVTTKHKGMGINSIDKRVEHLDGKMTIESELKKGTTIIIDIPL